MKYFISANYRLRSLNLLLGISWVAVHRRKRMYFIIWWQKCRMEATSKKKKWIKCEPTKKRWSSQATYGSVIFFISWSLLYYYFSFYFFYFWLCCSSRHLKLQHFHCCHHYFAAENTENEVSYKSVILINAMVYL